MASFGITLNTNYTVSKFVKATNKRLEGTSFLKNPFRESKIKQLKDMLAITITPVYLNFPLVAAFFMLPLVLVFKGWVWSAWYIPGLVFLVLTFFWSRFFYYIMICLGLRKASYKGKIIYISQTETIKRLIHNGTI